MKYTNTDRQEGRQAEQQAHICTVNSTQLKKRTIRLLKLFWGDGSQFESVICKMKRKLTNNKPLIYDPVSRLLEKESVVASVSVVKLWHGSNIVLV